MNLNKKSRILIGVSSGLLGVLFLGVSYYGMSNFEVRQKEASESYSIAKSDCIDRLTEMKLKPTEVGGYIMFEKVGVDNPKTDLSIASVALLACPGYEMNTFCYGEMCPGKPGLRVRMSKIEVDN